jgi:UDP-glucose 4-epimerase
MMRATRAASQSALDGIDVILHLAGRAHILRETAADPHAEFMRVNAEGTAALAAAAVTAGVRRLVYVSSVGVHGNTSGNTPLTIASPLQPHSPYTASKLAGEMAARAVSGERLDVVVLRVPLVYGSEVGANFLRLLRWIDKDWPLPFGSVHNRRSLVSVWNLCDLLLTLVTHRAAANRTWLVCDGEDLSTPELIRRIARAMGRRSRLVPIPVGLLRLVGTLTGRTAQITQLCSSLQVDATGTRRELGWSPVMSVDAAISRTVAWYQTEVAPRGA